MPHQHSHPHELNEINRAFIIGIILNLLFVCLEFIAGFYSNSLALLSDAGHNLSDIATLSLSLFAFKLAKKKATKKYTYGYDKGTIIASLANAVILLIAVGSIGWEAVQRLLEPRPVIASTIIWVAAAGVLVNGLSALLFFRSKENDLNVKGAYLHLFADALVSVAVVVSGIIIMYTGINWIDPLMSVIVMGVVLYSAWGLLTESLRLSLDGVPAAIKPDEINSIIMSEPGVSDVYHVHIWAISTTKNALTAHIKLQHGLTDEEVTELKKRIRARLACHHIDHVTLETEVG